MHARRTANTTNLESAPDDMMHSTLVLLMVDVINPLEFPEASKNTEAILHMAQRLASLKSSLRPQVVAVYANDHYGAWLSDFQKVKSRCLSLGGTPARLVEMLSPGPDDYVLLKPRHSAFYGTPLELLLTQLGCHSLILCGLVTDMCVQMTASDAYLRGFELWVPEDCCVAHTPEQHTEALAYMQRVFRADTRASGDALHDWMACALPNAETPTSPPSRRDS